MALGVSLVIISVAYLSSSRIDSMTPPREVSAMGTESWGNARVWIQDKGPEFVLFAVVGYEGVLTEKYEMLVDGRGDPALGNGLAVEWLYQFSSGTEYIMLKYSSIAPLSVKRGTLPVPFLPVATWGVDSDAAALRASSLSSYIASHSDVRISYLLTPDLGGDPSRTYWIITASGRGASPLQVIVDAVTGEIVR